MSETQASCAGSAGHTYLVEIAESAPTNINITVGQVKKPSSASSEPFWMASKAVFARRDLNGNEKVVYAIIVNLAKSTGLAWPRIDTIAKMAGIDESTVDRSIERLVNKGFVERSHRRNSKGIWESNTYKPCATLPPEQPRGKLPHGTKGQFAPLIEYTHPAPSLRSGAESRNIKPDGTSGAVPSGISPPDKEKQLESLAKAEQYRAPYLRRSASCSKKRSAAPRRPLPPLITAESAEFFTGGEELLELIEQGCRQAAKQNGIVFYSRTATDYEIAPRFANRLHLNNRTRKMVENLLAEYLAQCEHTSKAYTLTGFEKYADFQWKLTSNRKSAREARRRPKLEKAKVCMFLPSGYQDAFFSEEHDCWLLRKEAGFPVQWWFDPSLGGGQGNWVHVQMRDINSLVEKPAK